MVVVSEETGIVPIAENGRISRRLTPDQLRSRLRPLFTKVDTAIKVQDIRNAIDSWRKNK